MSLRIKVKESPENLLASIKSEKDGDKKDKLKLLKMVSEKEVLEIREAAEKLIRHVNTISSWLRKYRTGGIKKLLIEKSAGRKKGSLKYFKKKDLEKLKQALDNENGFRSYKDIELWVLKELNIKIPYHTLWHIVRKGLKSKLKVARSVNTMKDKEKEESFKKNFDGNKIKNIRIK